MAYVNYVRECKAFIAYASDNKITANEFVLWHALFNLVNLQATSNVWPDGFIPVSNSRLLSFTTFGCSDSAMETLRKTRDKLIQHGLIRYQAGQRNQKNPCYQLVYFCPESDGVTQSKLGNSLGNMQGNPLGNMQGNPLGNMQGNPLGNMGDITDKRIPDEYGIPKTEIPFDDEDESNTSARATETVRECFDLYFGREATPAEADAIAKVAVQNGITAPELIRRAMRTAAENGPRTPAAYVEALCREWGKKIAKWEREGYPKPVAAEG